MSIKNLILFDIDNTIAESSKEVKEDISNYLLDFKNKDIEIGLISGGQYEKILKQIDKCKDIFDYIFCENGMIGYKNFNKFFEKNLKDCFTNSQILEIEEFINEIIDKFVSKDNLIKLERRNSLWYFSPCGIYCNDEVKNNFIKKDKENNIRENIINYCKQDLEKLNLTIKLGGNTGFSILPINWDKSFIFKNNIIKINDYNKIYFFGDRCEVNGNDYPLYIYPHLQSFKVKNPIDTLEKLKKVFPNKN